MSLSSTMLREDQTIVFHCLSKDLPESHQFLKGSFFRPLHVHHGELILSSSWAHGPRKAQSG